MNQYPKLSDFEKIDQREAVKRIARLRGVQPQETVTVWEVLGVVAFVMLVVIVLPVLAGLLADMVVR